MPATPQEEWEYWDKKATDLRRDQLNTVQSSALKWSTVMTALLGVFGTVAFAGGLTTLDKLADPWATTAKILTTIAAGFAVIAIGLLNFAAGGLLVKKQVGFTPNQVRERYAAGATKDLKWLRWGQRAAVLTGILVIFGSGIVLWVGAKPSSPTLPTVVAIVNGKAVCGELSKRKDGTLVIGTNELTAVSKHSRRALCVMDHGLLRARDLS